MAKKPKLTKAQISALMAEWGRRGGTAADGAGGRASMVSMTPEDRTARAKKAVAARELKRRKK